MIPKFRNPDTNRHVWFILIVVAAIALLMTVNFVAGCGLVQWTPTKTTPAVAGKIGLTPKGEALFDGAAKAETKWGGLLQIAAGTVGLGGFVAAGRKMLRDRAAKKELEGANIEKYNALKEIIAGVTQHLTDRRTGGFNNADILATLDKEQGPTTKHIVDKLTGKN